MQLGGRRRSSNIEDRRNMRVGGMGGGGGLLRLLPLVFRFLGLKGTLVVVGLVGAYGIFSGNLSSMLGLQAPTAQQSSAPVQQSAQERAQAELVAIVLADTEETWNTIFAQKGWSYEEPRLVMFRDAVKSACGMAESAIGPFYCPGDKQVYIDLSFFDQLKSRHQAPGDFAQAYVIAHEVGHHIQTLLGTSKQVQEARSKLSKVEGNKLSVMQELQADCYAGVWANQANRHRHLLEAGDLEEGLNAASAIGDDTLQKQARGYVSPDSFTHGSAAQRVQWFKVGFQSGDMDKCDTFSALN